MKNITEEAIWNAKQDAIDEWPELSDRTYRESLDPLQKRHLFVMLNIKGQMWEDYLISKIQ